MQGRESWWDRENKEEEETGRERVVVREIASKASAWPAHVQSSPDMWRGRMVVFTSESTNGGAAAARARGGHSSSTVFQDSLSSSGTSPTPLWGMHPPWPLWVRGRPCSSPQWRGGGIPHRGANGRDQANPTLATTQGQIDGFFIHLLFKCYLLEVASVGDWHKICPWVASRVTSG